MAIRVRYFASLRERMGRIGEDINAEDIRTIADLWRVLDEGRPLPEQILCAVNQEHAEPSTPVQDGDEVAFFPPVTGG
jgi:sulfur-carrier protein